MTFRAYSGLTRHHPFARGFPNVFSQPLALAPGFATSPPLLGNLQHWFDFNDSSLLWQDTAGTVPITAVGQTIQRADNKGTDGTPISDAGSGLTWENAPNSGGKQAAFGNNSGDPMAVVQAIGNSGVTGLCIWQIVRANTGIVITNNAFQYGNFGGSPSTYGNRAPWDLTPPDDYLGIVGTVVISQGRDNSNYPEWVWQYTQNNAGSYRTNVAGGVEATGAEPYVQITTATKSVVLGAGSGYLLECGCYDVPLDSAQLGLLVSYMNGRIGAVLPVA